MTPCEELCAAAIAGDLETLDRMLDEDTALAGCHGSVREDHRAFMAREKADNGWTPLHLAAHYGQTGCVVRLIAAGADVNACSVNPLANTPLHAAVVGRNGDAVRALLSHGIDLTATDAGGSTALDLARANGANEIAGMIERATQEG